MLEVTARAKEKLKESLLEEQITDDEVTFRITPVHTMPNRLGIALDKARAGDQVVESKEGIKLLLIQSDLAQQLEGMVLDYQETDQGGSFKISRPLPMGARQGRA